MGYSYNTGFILYWNPDQPSVVHRSHHVCFDEYNHHISIEYNHTPGYLLIQQYTESRIRNSDLLNSFPCELYIISTPFYYTTTLTYDIDLPTYGKKIGFHLLGGEDFTIPYVTDTIPNSLAGHQLPT